jgi:rare lipoprotein A
MGGARFLGLAVLAVALALGGCSSKKRAALDPFAGKGSPYYPHKGPLPKGGGKYHVGQPYQVAGRWFKPHEDPNYDKVGVASWYGPQFHRRRTSNGEWFDMQAMTAAHPTLPLPSYARVTNLENGRQVVVRINDRGPFVGTRIIDLSRRSADALGFKNKGKAKVRVKYLGPAPLGDDTRQLAAMNRGQPVETMIARNEPPVEVARAEEPETEAGEGKTDFFVQVGSFADPDNAMRARADVASLGPVRVEETEGAEGVLYRVRLGPLANEIQAEEALSQVAAAGHDGARLVVAGNAY